MVRGEPEERELWSEIMDGGSREVVLEEDEVSEKAGDVSGVSRGRLMHGRAYSGVSCRGQSDAVDSLREDADEVVSSRLVVALAQAEQRSES